MQLSHTRAVTSAAFDDLGVLRHGGMSRVFTRRYAPATLGQFLRAFTFGHVRQLDAVAPRVLLKLAELSPPLGTAHGRGPEDRADRGAQQPVPISFLDIDDTIIEVHGHQKQGGGFGYSGVRGLNARVATLSSDNAPVLISVAFDMIFVLTGRSVRRSSVPRRGIHPLSPVLHRTP